MATQEVKNIQTLNSQAYKQKFDLDGTGYEPIETIGSGAYGIVCSAICKKTKDRVAIKKISPAFEHIDSWKSTYREIRILRHFKHENVISIREILEPKKVNFKDVQIVLDFMESDLHKIIHTQELSDEHIRLFLYQILRGLKYIHSANVIHRDLKPSNLLVNANCELKIGDFGMSRVVATSCSRDKPNNMTQYVATRWYRAPELIIPYREYTFSVDLWSVGCILAEMIGQKVLFRGRSQLDQYLLIVKKCGTPSQEYLDKYAEPYKQALTKNYHKPVEWATEFPKAHRKSLDMLNKLLRIDPRERITAEVALKHPYLSKYHEPQDEPVCGHPLDVDFEEKISATEHLSKLITEEIKIYHKPPNFGIPNLKPVPVEQIKLLNKKHQSLISETAVPQLSPRTTGLASFLQLQKKLDNHKSDSAAFKKPFPAVIANSVAPADGDTTGAKTNAKESAKTPATQGESGGPSDGELPLAQSFEAGIDSTRQNGSLHVNDLQQRSSSARNFPESTSKENPSPSTKGVDMKQRIRDVILKSQTKPRPALVDNRPKPVTAYQRRKENEKKREMLEARRKNRSRDKKQEGGISSMDKSMLERWEQMRKANEVSQPSKKPTSASSEEQKPKSVQAENAGEMRQLQENNSVTVSSAGGLPQATTMFTNVSGPILSSGYNITQNVYITLPTNVSFIPAVTPGPLVYNPEVLRPNPSFPAHSRTVALSLSNNPATPVLVVGDNMAQFSQVPLMQQSNAQSINIASAQTPNVVGNNLLPFVTYQNGSYPAVLGSGEVAGAGNFQNATNIHGSKQTSHDTIKDVLQTTSPVQPLQVPGDGDPSTNPPNTEDHRLKVISNIQRLSSQDVCDTPPVNVPFSGPSTSSCSSKRNIPEPLNMRQDFKKMRVDTNLQPSTPVFILTPTGKQGQFSVTLKGDSQLPSANSNLNSATTESAPASGLKRDWQQAINMDPKELEEALRTVWQTDLPSPRFFSDIINPKQ